MRIMLAVHGLPPDACGGTEVYTHDLARTLATRGHDVLVLARVADAGRAELEVTRETRDGYDAVLVNNTFRALTSFDEGYRHPRLASAVRAHIARFHPDVVHVQHMTCLSTDLFAEIARDAPTLMTLNDHWPLCHRGQLLDLDLEPCDGPGADGCGRCIDAPTGATTSLAARALARFPPAVGTGARAIARRLPRTPDGARAASRQRFDHMRAVLSAMDLLLAPSRSMAETMGRFGLPSDHVRRTHQGIDLSGFLPRPRTPNSGPLRIAFVGSLIPSKAPHVLLEAFTRLPAGRATIDIYGAVIPYHGDRSYAARLRPLLDQAGVAVHGVVPHHELPAALAQADCLVVPSTWRENSPFVVREAFAAGIPVVASRIGGLVEMVEDGRTGLLVPPGDAAALEHSLRRLLDEPGLLATLGADLPAVRSIDDDAADLEKIYQELVTRRAERSHLSGATAAVVLNHELPDETWLCARSLLAAGVEEGSLVIVDNGSSDGSVEQLTLDLPRAAIEALPRNAGFSAGCNAGIRRALRTSARYVLLVNNDVLVRPDTIVELVASLERDSSVAIAGPVVRSRSHPWQIASAGIDMSSASGRMRHRTEAPPTDTPVAAVTGCVMLVRRDLLETLGGFDEDYFFSFEDIDLCLRARHRGLATVVAAAACVYHEGGRTMGKTSSRRLYYAARNHLLLARRVLPPGPFAALRGANIVALNLAHGVLRSGTPRLAAVVRVLAGVVDHLRGRYGEGRSAKPRPRGDEPRAYDRR